MPQAGAAIRKLRLARLRFRSLARITSQMRPDLEAWPNYFFLGTLAHRTAAAHE